MRIVAIVLLLCLAACSGNPAAYGITGPGRAPSPPEQPDDASVGQPGLPDASAVYGPSLAPSTGPSGFWGYN
jgi:hypothetical protein